MTGLPPLYPPPPPPAPHPAAPPPKPPVLPKSPYVLGAPTGETVDRTCLPKKSCAPVPGLNQPPPPAPLSDPLPLGAPFPFVPGYAPPPLKEACPFICELNWPPAPPPPPAATKSVLF